MNPVAGMGEVGIRTVRMGSPAAVATLRMPAPDAARVAAAAEAGAVRLVLVGGVSSAGFVAAVEG